jgi:hypothetical protein
MFSDNISVPFDKTQERNYNLRVTPIKVMLNTNIPNTKPFPLNFSALYHHDLEKNRFSANQYSYPFFTNSVQYPMSVLAMKTYSDRVDFFFNKNRFTKICRKSGTNYIEYGDVVTESSTASNTTPNPTDAEIEKMEKENGDYNIKCMLILLLPIADEFTNLFQTSYEQYILNEPSSEIYTFRNIDPTTLLNPTWIPLYNYFSPKTYYKPVQEISYLKQNGKKYVVNGVIWLNDLVNHPVYRDFLSTFYQKMREKINNKKKIEKQMKERIGVFKGLLIKYQTYQDNGKSLWLIIIRTLLTNINGFDTAFFDKNTDVTYVKYIIDNTPNNVNQFNPKDQAKKETIHKICNSVLEIYKTTHEESEDNIKNFDEASIFQIVDNIVNAYVEYSQYNESADKGLLITLKDTTRIFVDLYNSAIFLKSIQLVDLFLNNKINRFDITEKNEDDTPKTKLELDIIRSIKKNFSYYVQLNDDILTHLKNVLEPVRRSSNNELQTFLKNLFQINSPSSSSDDAYALVDIYNKYITNMRETISDDIRNKYMYTGVNTVVNDDPSASGLGKECPEIYVSINVVAKDEYEKTPNRDCIMADDFLANKLKQLLFSNTMMDDTFPEISQYRSFRLLPGSEINRMADSVSTTNKSNSTNPYIVPSPAMNGGHTKKHKHSIVNKRRRNKTVKHCENAGVRNKRSKLRERRTEERG